VNFTGHQWPSTNPGVFHDFRFGWIVEISRELNRLLPEDYFALIEAPETRLEAKERPENFPEAVVYSMLGDHVSIRRALSNELVAVLEITSAGQREFTDQRSTLLQRIESWVTEGATVVVVDLFEVFGEDRAIKTDSHNVRVISEVHVEREVPVAVDFSRKILFPLDDTYWRAWEHVPHPLKELVEANSK
jgi:hypothetical protein